jgi:hypothetical protein
VGREEIDKLVFGCIIIHNRISFYVEHLIILCQIDYVSFVKQYHIFMFALPAQAEGTFYHGKDESTEIHWGDGGWYYDHDNYAIRGFGK